MRLVSDDECLCLFNDFSFALVTALLAFNRSREVDRSDSSCLGWFPYKFTEAMVQRIDYSTSQSLNRGSDGSMVSPESLPKVIVRWLQEDYIFFEDAKVTIIQIRGNVSSRGLHYPEVSVGSPD